MGNQEFLFIILERIIQNKGYYRDVLIHILQEEKFNLQEIVEGINHLSNLGMINCHGFHTAYVAHPNIELIFKKNPKINFSQLIEIWNDPEIIAELWIAEENERRNQN